ncbi:cellulase family glycosylhydrolase [Clostridium sp. C2-6-12]|uniref:cellulase family glycosylhydrolase n=1 Tax=Clostridium sp. C2-6-12 TaxID=2698832 RepID=UPI00136837ED|nr:cellulase family glycosylhydrolase [Clostridium sp. C2-6-12]
MRKIKMALTFFMTLMLTISLFNNFIFTVNAEEIKLTPSQKYANEMGPGWNLGNSFDSFDTNGDKGEMSWGNPIVTKDLIKTIKSQGFKSIRIPFTALMRTGSAPEYKIDEKFLNRYAEVVKWALDENLYVMINLHHDSWNWAKQIGSESDKGASMERYKAIWTQLANYFKEYSDKVCFESLNEPQFSSGDEQNQIKILEKVNTEFYNIVRNSGGKNKARMLILPTLNTNDSDNKCESLYSTIQSLKDENIIATFHYYGYWPFSTNIAGVTTMDDKVVSELQGSFDRMYNHFTSKGIGVICGEYGVLAFDKSLGAIEHGEMLKYFEYINYYAKTKNITLMLWDNGQHMNRTTLNWNDLSLYNQIKASWNSRSSYSESDRIFIKDENRKKDVSVKLTLNGNSFKEIYNGSQKLILDKDYSYDNNGTVTLKGNYINSIITDKYAENATLAFKFSAGADWNVYINHYKVPELNTGKGSTNSFEIPVKFNGSKLSTLEAINSDGTGAGPQNWTTYKEYDYAFSVDYNANKVIIKDKFFNEAKDGKINFKLHFQSGEILELNVLKSGESVIPVK